MNNLKWLLNTLLSVAIRGLNGPEEDCCEGRDGRAPSHTRGPDPQGDLERRNAILRGIRLSNVLVLDQNVPPGKRACSPGMDLDMNLATVEKL